MMIHHHIVVLHDRVTVHIKMTSQAEGMVEDFVLNMTNNNIELRKHCASAIFKCAQVTIYLFISLPG